MPRRAIQALNSYSMGGRPLRVNEAQDKPRAAVAVVRAVAAAAVVAAAAAVAVAAVGHGGGGGGGAGTLLLANRCGCKGRREPGLCFSTLSDRYCASARDWPSGRYCAWVSPAAAARG